MLKPLCNNVLHTCSESHTKSWPSSLWYVVCFMCPYWQHSYNIISSWIQPMECCQNKAYVLSVGNSCSISKVVTRFFVLNNVGVELWHAIVQNKLLKLYVSKWWSHSTSNHGLFCHVRFHYKKGNNRCYYMNVL